MNISDIEEAEAVSGVHCHVLRRYIREGILPAKQFAGGRYLLNETEFNDFLTRYRAGEFDGRRKD
jgi:predicted site-specific integrase-resolvase